MKDTGVIRKIDELGRIVIPKEIRRSLGIRDGENLEIFVSSDGICLQKHSRLLNYQELANQLCLFSYEIMNYKILIFDREEVIASFQNEYKHISINSKLSKLLENRETYESMSKEKILEEVESSYYFIYPLIISTDVVGLMMFLSDSTFSTEQKRFLQFLSKLLINKIDVL